MTRDLKLPAPEVESRNGSSRFADDPLSDDGGDFADKTIVDVVPKPAAQAPQQASQVSIHEAVRVAVARLESGQLDVLVLADGEAAPAGTDEALLVPLSAGSQLWR